MLLVLCYSELRDRLSQHGCSIMKELLEHFGFAMPFVYAAAAYGVFVWLDNETSDQAKAALASTMRLKDYDGKRIASALVEVFDRLYTVPLLHWRAMSRSALFTIIITAVFAFEMRNRFFRLGSTAAAWEFYAGSLATNLVSDYVSLFLIRPCLRKCGSRPVRFGLGNVPWHCRSRTAHPGRSVHCDDATVRARWNPFCHNGREPGNSRESDRLCDYRFRLC